MMGPLMNARYKRVSKLGEGAEGIVYKVEDTKETDEKYKLYLKVFKFYLK